MSSLSLMKSIATCRVDTAQTNRIQSDRFLNPNSMVCVNWNGMDSVGRTICRDSWNTKAAGCNSATDRVSIENDLRPNYIEYVNLDGGVINSDLYGSNPSFAVTRTSQTAKYDNNLNSNVPHFGGQFQATNAPSCPMDSYERSVALTNQANRKNAYNWSSYKSNRNKCMAGL